MKRLMVWPLSMLLALSVSAGAADEHATLRERAAALWQARVQGDWPTVYDLAVVPGQSVTSKDQFVAYQEKEGPFEYLSAQVEEAEILGDLGWVRVIYAARPKQFRGVPPTQVEVWDIWVRRDGQWRPVPQASLSEVPQRPPSVRPPEEEAALAARVRAYWAARVGGDYQTVYGMLVERYRERTPLDKFLARRALLIYLAHDVEWAEVTGESGRAKVVYTYKLNDPSLSKMTPQQAVEFETWEKVDGQWYLDPSPKKESGPS